MESFKYVDLFATKGIEYLFIISFLLLLIVYWRYLNKPVMTAIKPALTKIKTSLVDWFTMADDYYYHQGHAWAVPEEKNVLRVGMDDFAQKLVGRASALQLPKVGDRLSQGEAGWKMNIDSRTISMLSPVEGEVIAVNQKVIDSPGILNETPYKDGWILKVKTDKMETNLKNLLSGKLAKAWMEETVEKVGNAITGHGGLVMQDGGQMISGFAKELDSENWETFAASFLLTNDK
jgi:glycine cleavage system H lipoate-binding protein